MLIKFINKNISTTLAILILAAGVLLSYFTYIVGNYPRILNTITLITGALIFLLIFQGRYVTDINIKVYDKNPLISKIIILTFIFGIVLTTTLFHLEGNWKTIAIILLNTGLYTITAIYIILSGEKATSLLLISISGIVTRVTGYYSTSIFVGVGVYSHNNAATQITDLGNITPLNESKYFFAPLYHIFNSISTEILRLDIIDAISLTIIPIIVIIPVLVIYSITAKFWNSNIALLASLIFIAADEPIRVAVSITTQTYSLAIYFILILILFNYMIRPTKRYVILTLLPIFILVLSHQITLFISMVIISILLLTLMLCNRKLNLRYIIIITISIITTYVDSDITRWGVDSETTFLSRVLSNTLFAFIDRVDSEGIQNLSQFDQYGSMIHNLTNEFGYFLFLTLGIIGGLYWVKYSSNKPNLKYVFALGATVTILLVFSEGGSVIGLSPILPHRWELFSYSLISIFASVGIISIVHLINNKRNVTLGTIIFILLIFTLIGSMNITYSANQHDPILQSTGSERLSLTESEKSMLEFSSQHSSIATNLYRDHRLERPLEEYFSTESNIISLDSDLNMVNSSKKSLLLYRGYLQTGMADIELQSNLGETRIQTDINLYPSNSISTVYDDGDNRVKYGTNFQFEVGN